MRFLCHHVCIQDYSPESSFYSDMCSTESHIEAICLIIIVIMTSLLSMVACLRPGPYLVAWST